MAAGAEREIWACGALADQAEAEVNLLALFLSTSALPSKRVEREWVLEVLFVHSRDAGCAEDVVAGWDDEVGVGDVHRGFDFAHDRVQRRVDAQCLADHMVKDGAVGEFLVCEWGEFLAEDALLLSIEVFDEVGLVRSVQEHPSGGGHASVLAGHKKRNHHMCDIAVRDRTTIFVGAVHQVPDHVRVLNAVSSGCASLLDDVHVKFCHGALGVVAALVGWEGEPREKKIGRGEAGVKVVEKMCEGAVEGIADLLALEGAGSREQGELGDDVGEWHGAAGAFEVLGSFNQIFDLFNDQRDVGFEGFGGEAEFHELGGMLE